MADKQHAHQLIDQLAPGHPDPVAASMANAPVEEESATPEEAAALNAAHASIRRGEGIPHEEILREFGLAPRS